MEEQTEYGYREDVVKVIDKRHTPTATMPVTSDRLIAAMQTNNPEIIREMMALEREYKKDLAREAYFDAVASFKEEAPPVRKDKYNKFFDSWYTSLGNLLDTYNPVLGRNGLSVSFPTPQQEEKSMTVECRMSHRLGHTESISMKGPIDEAAIGKQSGQRSRNPIQDIKSTFTYLRSATLEAILGVSGTDASQDDDGNGAGQTAEFISPEQAKELYALITGCGDKAAWVTDKIMELNKIETIDALPASGFAKAVAWIKSTVKKPPKRDTT